VPEQPVLGGRFKIFMSEAGKRIGDSCGLLFGYPGKPSEFPAGPPFSLYHDEER
jgi:hypothetical protein